jgi:type IV secretion system protein VirB10
MSTQTNELMSPAASPGTKSNVSGVRRVNNLPLFIVVGGLGVFLLILMLVAADRAAQQKLPGEPITSGKGGNTSMLAKEIVGDQQDGIVQAKPVPAPAVPELAPPASIGILRPANLDEPPLPPNSQQREQVSPGRSPRDEDSERIRTMKLQQFEEAVKARTALPVAMARSAASSENAGRGASVGGDEMQEHLAALRQQIEAGAGDDPTAAYRQRLQQLQGGAGGASGAAGGTALPNLVQVASGRNDLRQFGTQGQGDRWKLDSQLEAPRTPYELRAGFVVPATLISGINSELPGQIVAQVSRDVYDTPLGRYKLIPQGSRLVGSYSSEVAYGQSRIFIAWQRIVFPDGKAMDIGAMPGADSAGYAGFKDQVNNHYFRLFSSALLMSSVTAGIALSQPETGNFNARQTASSAMSEALGQQLGQVTAQLISKNLNIAPTLEIRPGYRFNVVVIKDLTFARPYAAFDY